MTPRSVPPTVMPAALLVALAMLLAALLPAAAGAASSKATPTKLYPSIKKVSPKKAGIGDRMTITGKGFRKGKNKNTVVFKRDGKRAIFVRATGTSTKRISVLIPAKLLPMLAQEKGTAVSTRFRVRVLAARFGRRYTSAKSSPMIGPVPLSTKGRSDDCDGDGVRNGTDRDDDNDLLSDTLEATLGTQACLRDSDGDGMSDAWEYYSALDRNGKAKPAPTRKPYPNALDKTDATIDHDGDGLSNLEEYVAWVTLSSRLRPEDSDPLTSRLTYSGGNPNSDGRSRRPDALAYMDRDGNGFLSDFERDADGDGIPNMDEDRGGTTAYGVTVGQTDDDPRYYDYGLFGSLFLEKVAKVRSQDKTLCGGINQVAFYCTDLAEGGSVTVSKVDPLNWVDADSDGDGIRDDLDDVDHDDVPNLAEYLAELGSLPSERKFRHLDACVPNVDSRYCLLATIDVDGDGISNREDTDDDGDLVPDDEEARIGTSSLRYDTDNDGLSDGFEYYSALDLNRAPVFGSATGYPIKQPYPNPLDGDDGDVDHDGDGLTARQEHRAWRYTGGQLPLSYSDGQQWSGGKAPASSASQFGRGSTDIDGNGSISDDEKDVDDDGATNYAEASGPLSSPDWWDRYTKELRNRGNGCDAEYYTETAYKEPKYEGLNFTNPDTDGDGIPDGEDDIDHDGINNTDESYRPSNWCATYVSIGGRGNDPGHNWDGSTIVPEYGAVPDPYARVQPFNPCKPVYSDACHLRPPLGHYKEIPATSSDPGYYEDWASPVHP